MGGAGRLRRPLVGRLHVRLARARGLRAAHVPRAALRRGRGAARPGVRGHPPAAPAQRGTSGATSIVTGLILQALYFALLYGAIGLDAPAGTAALIVSLQPILVGAAGARAWPASTSARSAGSASCSGWSGAAEVIVARQGVECDPGRRAALHARGPGRAHGRHAVREPLRRRAAPGHREPRPVRGGARCRRTRRRAVRGPPRRLDGRPDRARSATSSSPTRCSRSRSC